MLLLWSSPVVVTGSAAAGRVRPIGSAQRVGRSCAIPRSSCSSRRAFNFRKSGGVASAASLRTASSSGSTSCASPPSRRSATVRFSASRRPTTTSTGTWARLCSRTLALIFWLVRSVSTASPALRQRRRHLLGIGVGVGDDGRHHRLHRRQPEREAAGIVLDQDAEEALEAAQDGAVQHHRAVPRAVLGDVFGVQPLRQDEVHLQRAALPVAPDRVAQHEFQLRAVERALARVQRVLDAGGARRPPSARPRPGPTPRRRRSACAGRSENFTAELREAEVAVDRRQQLDEPHRLRRRSAPRCRRCARRPG